MPAEAEVSDCFERIDGFPWPNWSSLRTRINERYDARIRRERWTEIARMWLDELREFYGRSHYFVEESDHFLIFNWLPERQSKLLASISEQCRQRLLDALPGLADSGSPGKEVALVFCHAEDYYSYVAAYDADGNYGGSSGRHIRVDYPHLVAHGKEYNVIEPTISHELTHAFLSHRSLPLWIEEGLAQIFESEVTTLRPPVVITTEMKGEHLRYWRANGLDAFWRGESFSSPDGGQKLSYELAEVMLRLLFLDFGPRWFGLDQRGPRKLLSFFETAKCDDCGQIAAIAQLNCNLAALASKFLGPGDWGPTSQR